MSKLGADEHFNNGCAWLKTSYQIHKTNLEPYLLSAHIRLPDVPHVTSHKHSDGSETQPGDGHQYSCEKQSLFEYMDP